ncbi:MAG: hypothetical protein QF578_02045 [Alphaproteobacteria bacterium]|jgi:hypothetical protein|nr:hypothetical protein [Alphaproteobacteria bacterium]MDP6563585.1 hypothetical protein [Alphaproteobacteria bacterium]MDP6814266.1 hypothetical protein [Alphaproteobacteria bacterium]
MPSSRESEYEQALRRLIDLRFKARSGAAAAKRELRALERDFYGQVLKTPPPPAKKRPSKEGTA